MAHRSSCVTHAEFLTDGDHKSLSRVKLFIKWLDLWRDALLSWAVFAADVANHDGEYLASHWFVLTNYVACVGSYLVRTVLLSPLQGAAVFLEKR
jgi:hypothetical protein